MRWAKATLYGEPAEVDLAQSGLGPPGDLPFEVEVSDFALTPRDWDGDPVVTGAVAERDGVAEVEVLPVMGASGGMYLALAALVEPGAVVAVETPAYGALTQLPGALGLRSLPLRRRWQEDWAVTEEAVAGVLADGAKLVLVTDLHNPTGAHLAPGDPPGHVSRLADLCEAAGARLVVNEIYREFLEDGPQARRRDSRVVSISSLTKAYGLGSLRCGWVSAPPEALDACRRYADYLWVVMPPVTMVLAGKALATLDSLRGRALDIQAGARPVIDAWVDATPGVSWIPPAGGICGFLRLPDGLTGTALLPRAHSQGTRVVPGAFFGDDAFVRIGFGRDPAQLADGLARLARALGS